MDQPTMGRPQQIPDNNGLTIIELLVAAVLTSVMLLGVYRAFQLQGLVTQNIRAKAGTSNLDLKPSLAEVQLIKDLERADRARIINDAGGLPNAIQLRKSAMTTAACTGAGVVPAPSCFDDPANYQWVEYAHVDLNAAVPGKDSLVFYDNTSAGCGTAFTLSDKISAVSFAFANEAPAPPGGEPFPPGTEDNNLVDYRFQWDGPVADVVLSATGRLFRGKMTIRGGTYGNVNASTTATTKDSGTGLAPSTVSLPPALCRP